MITLTWRARCLIKAREFAVFFFLLASCSWSGSTSLSLEGTVAPCGINTEPNLGFINPLAPRQLDKWSCVLCHAFRAALPSLTIILEGSQSILFEVY